MATEDPSKSRPGLRPPAEDSLRRSLERYREQGAEAKDQEAGKIEVNLRIGGGLPSQRFHLDFQATGDEIVRCQVRCEMSGRRAETDSVKLQGREVQELAGRILESGLLDLPQEPPSFLPDTVVGWLEISDGRSKRRYYFAADPDQAETQGKVPPPPLKAVVEAIYRLGERLTGVSVKP